MDRLRLEEELKAVWARVSGSRGTSSEAPLGDQIAETAHDLSAQALSSLRKRFRDEKQEWQKFLAAQEKELAGSQEKIAGLESRVKELSEQLEQERQTQWAQAVQQTAELETRRDEEQRHRKLLEDELIFFKQASEEAGLRVEQERTSFEKLRAEWQRREEELDRILSRKDEELLQQEAEFEGREAEKFREIERWSNQCRDLEQRIDQGERALSSEREKSAQILAVREQEIKSLTEALQSSVVQMLEERRAKEVQAEKSKHYDASLHQMDEERNRLLQEIERHESEWRDLWNRERESWDREQKRSESWEGRMGKEREQLLETLGTVKTWQTREAEKIHDLLDSVQAVARWPGEKAGPWLARLSQRQRAVGAGVLAVLCLFVWTARASRTRVSPVPQEHPSGLVFDGQSLWTCDWWDRKILRHDPESPETVLKTFPLVQDFRPTALAFDGKGLWSCDTNDRKILRHNPENPSEIVSIIPAPGPTPTGLAWDGSVLWSCDQSAKTVYSHRDDAVLSVSRSFSLGAVEPAAMTWRDGKLWVYDVSDQKVVVYQFPGQVKKVAEYKLFLPNPASQGAVALGFVKGRLWVLSEDPKFFYQLSLLRLRWKNLFE